MSLVLITNPDDPVLHRPTEIVTDVEEVRHYLPEMIRLCLAENALGLAANQVGLPHRMFVTTLPGDWPRVWVNPDAQLYGKQVVSEEGCLSNPGQTVKRKRRQSVRIIALDASGEQKLVDSRKGYYRGPRRGLGNLLAIVVQHEMEHLDGIDTRTG